MLKKNIIEWLENPYDYLDIDIKDINDLIE